MQLEKYVPWTVSGSHRQNRNLEALVTAQCWPGSFPSILCPSARRPCKGLSLHKDTCDDQTFRSTTSSAASSHFSASLAWSVIKSQAFWGWREAAAVTYDIRGHQNLHDAVSWVLLTDQLTDRHAFLVRPDRYTQLSASAPTTEDVIIPCQVNPVREIQSLL